MQEKLENGQYFIYVVKMWKNMLMYYRDGPLEKIW